MTDVKLKEERKNGIKFFTISDKKLKIVVTNIGCRVVSIYCPDKTGKMSDVILGLKNIDDYVDDPAYMGAIVGRVANRIGNAAFELNGKIYNLAANNGKNSLHGGTVGFDKKIFDHEFIENGIRFSYFSEDGEEGYPGNLTVNIEYTVDNNEFIISYYAKSDADTIVNLTNHMYFNLSDVQDSILNHYLRIDADKVGCIDNECLANGELMGVVGTPFDFRISKQIGRDINCDNIQLANAKGYDHPFILNGDENQICLEEVESGRKLTISTNAPAVQLYTGNYLSGGCVGKHGCPYRDFEGVALETEYMPNSINTEENPAVLLRAGEIYKIQTGYKFGLI